VSAFTDLELAYLASQRLGRLATVDADGAPQVNPVSVYHNAALDCLDIAGHDMASSRKFRNVLANGRAAIVVDDVESFQPRATRSMKIHCLEIRGLAEAIPAPADSAARMPGPIIRIHPRRIISWGIDPPETSRGRRTVGP
jgi:pyridoxamine 5'-phosphate oxidase family protein